MGIYVITFVRENGKTRTTTAMGTKVCLTVHAHTWFIHASVDRGMESNSIGFWFDALQRVFHRDPTYRRGLVRESKSHYMGILFIFFVSFRTHGACHIGLRVSM